MPYGAHETMEVHEILNEKINMINHFAFYSEQAKDPRLQQMIKRHLQSAINGYDQLVAYTHNYNTVSPFTLTSSKLDVQPQQIQYGLHNPAQVSPLMNGSFADLQIVYALLSFHKNSAKNQLSSSLECADPNVRQMLIHEATICANQAYEVFLFMNEQGQYQVPTMQDQTAKTFLHTYQPTQDNMIDESNRDSQTYQQ